MIQKIRKEIQTSNHNLQNRDEKTKQLLLTVYNHYRVHNVH